MTVSSYKKMLKQVRAKPQKMIRFNKFNKPKERKFGKNVKCCSRCGNTRAHIGKYGINLCRRCFKDVATKIGFRKYS